MKRFKRILCVIDPRQPTNTVLERAVSLAQNNQATLTVASVAPRVTAGIGMPDGGPISAELQEAQIADSRQQLENAVEHGLAMARKKLSKAKRYTLADYNRLCAKLGDTLVGHTFYDAVSAMTETLAVTIAEGCANEVTAQEVTNSVVEALPQRVSDLRREQGQGLH